MKSNYKGLPSTTSYKVDSNILFIKHRSFLISNDEANAIFTLMQEAFLSKEIQAIVIDNQEATGVWSQEILSLWDKLGPTIKETNTKLITLTNSNIAMSQMNRITRGNNLTHLVRAFHSDFNDTVKAFINE